LIASFPEQLQSGVAKPGFHAKPSVPTYTRARNPADYLVYRNKRWKEEAEDGVEKDRGGHCGLSEFNGATEIADSSDQKGGASQRDMLHYSFQLHTSEQ
jgi:hypothetical protein